MAIEHEIREELFRIKTHIDKLIKSLDKVISQPVDLFAEQEKTEQLPERTIKKSANPFFSPLKKLFMEYYKEHKQVDYMWGAKDSKAMNSISDKILLSNGVNKREAYENPKSYEDAITSTLEIMLRDLEVADKFVYDNLSVNFFDSRFSTIASKIKERRTTKTQNLTYEQELKDKIGNENN